MMQIKDVIQDYKDKLNADYFGDYLNETKLSEQYDYKEVLATIKPDVNEKAHRFFSGSVRFKGSKRRTLNFEFIELKLVGNFGGRRIRNKLKPYQGVKFETSGNNHSFYTDVENILLNRLHDKPDFQCWVSLLYNYENNFKPEDFGLAVMFVEDNTNYFYMKHNAFVWNAPLFYNEDYNQFKCRTVSREICKN